MISSMTFKQDNTIADEPMVNLLKELNGMLDSAVANARLPTGQNPLQQLILIIADVRLHEKESLKRYVQDVLSRKRMIAFILLDSPQESIVDLMRSTYPGGKLSFSSRYINSFPFPYYSVLKNNESLPRTMVGFLRQRATCPGGKLSFSSRYINSFPFPYYGVLKNIESLPRTMAGLLRQWFELMQSSGD